VPEDQTQIEVLQDIFQDFINSKNLSYYKMFLDYMVNTLLSLYSHSKITSPTSDDIIITELDDWKSLDNDKVNKAKKIVYFQTSLLNEKDFNNLE
jgi:hypothetical protein